ncbi:MAG: ATP synthase F1 subunit epsilon [Planctomycetota bacterium]|nr:MAG: ATP synthase F1 subunit epsilon [Planctomycetota bacterium]REJ87613.1 MAG: ATP synthase F1 subunit epsilon [Planctomycetota bacterium]REK30163.1 MAG: ATP synthase F1 subunit epsilon [Planctomycetota bacterium]REK43310.1 MAG: ATP synthase F1 subunit epsilon [Planctomycetota bacterium]
MSIDATGAVRVLEVSVVTPEASVLETPAQFVALPLFDGELGIAPGHAPMIGRLGYGEMRVTEGDRVRKFFVEGGFVQVTGNNVSVLTNRAIPAEQIELDKAEELLAAALSRPARGEDELAIRDRNVAQARAQRRIAFARG